MVQRLRAGGPADNNLEVKIVVTAADEVDGGDVILDDGGVATGEPPQGSGSGDPLRPRRRPAATARKVAIPSGGCAVSATSNRSEKTDGFAIVLAVGIAALGRRKRRSV